MLNQQVLAIMLAQHLLNQQVLPIMSAQHLLNQQVLAIMLAQHLLNQHVLGIILSQHLLNQQVLGMSCMAMFAAFPSTIITTMEPPPPAPAPLLWNPYCGWEGSKHSNTTHPQHLLIRQVL